MLVKVLAILAAGASLVQADCPYPPPLANQLAGNSLTRPDGLHTPVKGQEFDIIWDATGLSNSVQLVLLRGPGDNIKFLEYITQDAPNTGAYKWTPEASLEVDVTHYGLMIIDNASCRFQWSTQFGIAANPNAPSSAPPAPSSTKSWPPKSWPTTLTAKPPPHSDAPESWTKPPHPAPSEDCSEKPSKSPAAPWSPGATWGPQGGTPWGPAKNSTWAPTSTGGSWATSTYTPLQANDGARLGMSMFGAAAALAAAVFVL